MKSEKILLLDVHVEGMEERLKELEWNAITVTKLFGSTEQDRQDEKIFDYAKPLVDSSNQIEIVQKELWRLFRDEEDAIKRKKILDSIIVAAEKKVNLSKSGTVLSLNASGELFQLEKKVMSDLQT